MQSRLLPGWPGATLIALASMLASDGFASSPNAWEEFGKDVQARCLRAARSNPDIKNPTIVVDPYGSESYGAAIITSRPPRGQLARYVCIYHKRTKKVELVGSFDG